MEPLIINSTETPPVEPGDETSSTTPSLEPFECEIG